MPTKEYEHPPLEEVALPDLMQALSDPCRIAILRALLERQELACNELPVEVAKATLSHHMAVLRDAGLIFTRVEGTKCLNTVRADEVEARFPGILKLVSQPAA
ncbi:ArsR/SmtB family transcription factor [Coraliomargarita parva]|uniref:ArsR/SmtB family transcription factor n=1 Tax=Coraliomargarita parva TaxID=3014050 RepID=UPI0022B52C35|nr:metalloregulator ArsR/SmtB family transcription factor [Coraliomargarita parva]